MKKIIGIDFGTTNSCVAVMENGDPVVLPNSEGARTTPSMVGFTENDERFVGPQAKRQAIINPTRTIFGVKRLIGRKADDPEIQRITPLLPYEIVAHSNGDAWLRIDERSFSPQEIAGLVLAKLKSAAEDYFGEEVSQAVITVPAYYNDAQRQATRDAGRIAGLEVRRIINEPTAAALAYGFQRREQGRIAVFDLGGGTFDISVLELRKGTFKVLATAGDNALGGEDFDRAILQFMIEQFHEQTGIDISDDKMALQRLKEAAENAKCELSTIRETNINLPFLAVDDNGPQHLSLTLGRSRLNELVSFLVDRVEGPCRDAVREAGLSMSDISEVVLVGGMTRMPLVQEKVEAIFGRKPHKGVNPDEVVAIGAAVQSAILGGELREIVLLDVTPLNLGIRVAGDAVSILIPRNSPIPTRANKLFTTTEDQQEFVQITVVQGDSPRASENTQLGQFTLTGIPKGPAGQARIEVSFSIDADGIVNVSAVDKHTQQKQGITVQHGFGLTAEEIEGARSRAG
ncbi:MAG: molecular chaperone DnaK [Myxococcota bacterium]|nr:molecular chaperone DnaK [Myxococcota bacterium]